MYPSFFGDPRSQLYGVYHPDGAPGRQSSNTGVLLCYPGPQETMYVHWSFRRLAAMLTARGFPVFRFDYFGTGDSAGDDIEATLSRWVADVADAADELRDLAEVSQVAVVGLRLGAVAATRAVAGGLAACDLVLWDPVVSGPAYEHEMESTFRIRDARLLSPQRRGEGVGVADFGGYGASVAMRADLRHIDLHREPIPSGARLHFVVSEATDPVTRLHRRYAASGGVVSWRAVPEDGAVLRARAAAKLFSRSLEQICDLLT